jgi:hypothetical protein
MGVPAGGVDGGGGGSETGTSTVSPSAVQFELATPVAKARSGV